MSVTLYEGGARRPTPGSIADHAVAKGRVMYRSLMNDNLRWDALELREGDIVISAPSKCGMTWTQRLVSLLIFDGPDLPGPMSTVSPWLDQTIRPIGEVVGGLNAQRHRRFIKTHTPLDGLVLDDRVTYIGVGRDPRDAAMSMLAQLTNMDPQRMRALHEAAAPPPGRFGAPPHEQFGPPGGDVALDLSPRQVLRGWIERPVMSPEGMASLATVMHHFDSVWQRRHLGNVAPFHYADFQVDLVGELMRLGEVLGVRLGRHRAAELAEYASLGAMRARASQLAPNTTDGMWRSDERFFRSGGHGEWRDIFTETEDRRYGQRLDELASPDLLAWTHGGRLAHDPAHQARR